MRFNTIQVISILAVFQSLFISFHFARLKKGIRPVNIILSLLMAMFAILIVIALSLTIGLEHILINYHKPVFLVRQCAFLIGPLLFYYIRIMLNPGFQFKRADFLHIFPFLLSLGIYSYIIAPFDIFIIWLSDITVLNTALILLHNIFYIVLSFVVLRKNRFSFRLTQDSSVKTKQVWMFLIIIGTIVFWMVELNSLIILSLLEYIEYCPHMAGLYSANAFLFVNSIAYFVVAKPELFFRNSKYTNSRLDENTKNTTSKKLKAYLENEKPYYDPSFSLSDLANKLSISNRDLSQVINEQFHFHFYDLINKYRIEECKSLLIDSSNGKKTILEICYSVGFNSKSAFNTAFKKHTGMNPSQFRNNNGH